MAHATKIRGKTRTGKAVILDKSQPLQMSLFQTFINKDDKYSNTIELYDAIPKYYPSRQLNRLRENGKYLPILKRNFRYRNPLTNENTTYQVHIKPARMEDENGQIREYYPTEREELVEEALRKIATDNLNGVYLNDNAGVQFTLYQLRKELAIRGHSIHFNSLIQSLNICNEAIIEVRSDDGMNVLKSPILPVLLISSRKEWLQSPKDTRCYVQFNPLVTHSINRLTYRQFDYVTFMQYKSQLARWLHKKLSHNYINANHSNFYHILASSIIRDSSLTQTGRFRDNIATIDHALDELKNRNVLSRHDKEIMNSERKNKIADVKYTLYPAHSFVSEMKAANKRRQLSGEQIRISGYAPK